MTVTVENDSRKKKKSDLLRKNGSDPKGGNEEFNHFWSIKYMSKV